MPDNVLDLDTLRPKARIVQLSGKTIDVSFVPCGITFDVDELVSQLRDVVKAMETETGLTGEDAVRSSGNSPSTKIAFDIGVKLCALFCSVRHPEMDEDWFMQNTSPKVICLTPFNRFGYLLPATLIYSIKAFHVA